MGGERREGEVGGRGREEGGGGFEKERLTSNLLLAWKKNLYNKH